MILIGALLDAPLMAVRRRWPDVLHAVDMDGIIKGWDRGSYCSVCGLKGLRLVGVDVKGRTIGACWPPRLKGMPKGRVRCQECYVTTGKMRPRVEYKPVGVVEDIDGGT